MPARGPPWRPGRSCYLSPDSRSDVLPIFAAALTLSLSRCAGEGNRLAWGGSAASFGRGVAKASLGGERLTLTLSLSRCAGEGNRLAWGGSAASFGRGVAKASLGGERLTLTLTLA